MMIGTPLGELAGDDIVLLRQHEAAGVRPDDPAGVWRTTLANAVRQFFTLGLAKPTSCRGTPSPLSTAPSAHDADAPMHSQSVLDHAPPNTVLRTSRH